MRRLLSTSVATCIAAGAVVLATHVGAGAEDAYTEGQARSTETPVRFRFDDPRGEARVSAGAAVAAVRAAGHLPEGVRPVVALGQFTDRDFGPVVNGDVQPLIKDRLAYVLTFEAPGRPGGGGVHTPTGGHAVIDGCRHTFVVDAISGDYLSGVEDCSR